MAESQRLCEHRVQLLVDGTQLQVLGDAAAGLLQEAALAKHGRNAAEHKQDEEAPGVAVGDRHHDVALRNLNVKMKIANERTVREWTGSEYLTKALGTLLEPTVYGRPSPLLSMSMS